MCPFGWLQELLHKIPGKKLSTKKLKPLTYVKYAVLLFAVVLLPVLIVNDVGMGDPFFCKYICPMGVLEGAIPLAIVNTGIRSALGQLFAWKLIILIAAVVLSVLFYRPFCKWICPLGAFYALMNKVSLLGVQVDQRICVSCGSCAKACRMDVDVRRSPNHAECIRQLRTPSRFTTMKRPRSPVSRRNIFSNYNMARPLETAYNIEATTLPGPDFPGPKRRRYDRSIYGRLSMMRRVLSVMLLSLLACAAPFFGDAAWA